MKPVLVNSSVARTCFEFSGCPGLSAADITIEVTRKGSAEQTIVYPALSYGDGMVCFAWDFALWNAPRGRYQGIIRAKGCKPLCVGLHLDCPCSIGKSVNEYFSSDCEECGNGL